MTRRPGLTALLPLGAAAVMLLAAGCSDANAPTTGELDVSVTTTGGDLDLDGYLVTVDGAAQQPLTVNGQVALLGLPTGPHDVELSGVAGNCTVSGANPRSVTITAGETAEIAFQVSCVATGVQVVIATTGADIDPDGYAVSVDGAPPLAVTVNASVSITRLTAGSHTVTLSGVVGNCAASGTNPRSVNVAAGEVVSVGFPVTCLATTGSVEVKAVTSGIDVDPNGYTVQVDNGTPRTLAVNATTVFEGLSAGDRSITLAGAAANCTAAGDNPRTVPVTTGGVTRDTARTTFEVTCVATNGVIEVTAATSGVDLDGNGYTLQVDNGTPQPVGVNGTVRFNGVSGGAHQVVLAGAATNCTVSGDNPRSVPVTTGGVTRDTARTTFAVTCVATTGTLQVTVATSGTQLDPDGYTVDVDQVCDYYYCYYVWTESVGINGTVRIGPVPVGPHVVWLNAVAPNCIVAGENPRTATVPPGDTAKVTFAVTCEPTGSVRVTTTTMGFDLDPDGYSVQVQGARGYATASVPTNGTVTLSQLLAGDYSVTLSGMARNCSVGGQNPATVTVVGSTTVDVAFTVTCTALGSVRVTAATTGADLDPDGYSVRVQGAGFDVTTSVATNATVTISSLVAGAYTVTLSGVAANCDLAAPNPRTVGVASGETATVAFDVACAQATQLALALTVNGNTDIYTVKSNGAGLTRLTTDAAYEDAPAWSPDGSKIAFRSDRAGNAEIYVMNENGSGQVRLTNHPAADYRPTWSPDGTKIAFVSERDANGGAEIYVMSADGTNPVRLTNHPAADADPAWSPDGGRIAFWSNRDGNGEIYVMTPDGSGVTRLTNNGVDDVQPEWSPDGTKLVFSRLTGCDSYTGFCDYDLLVMNADGSGAGQLTSGSSDNDAAWSPDGRWIAFGASFCYSYYYYGCYFSYSAVHVVRGDGTRVVELLRDAIHPAWRP